VPHRVALISDSDTDFVPVFFGFSLAVSQTPAEAAVLHTLLVFAIQFSDRALECERRLTTESGENDIKLRSNMFRMTFL